MTFLAAQYDTALGYTARQDRLVVGAAFQNGVQGATDLAVSAATGYNSQIAAGVASIRNTVQTPLGGRYLVGNNGAVTALHTNPDASFPRLDQVFIKVFDSRDGGDASDIVLPVVVPGTPQPTSPSATALLASRAGVGAVPTNSILVADAYVPAAASNATDYTYRDRRPWMRGAFTVLVGSGSGNYSETTGALSPIDLTNLQARVECSGAPVVITFAFEYSNNTATLNTQIGVVSLLMDGALIRGTNYPLEVVPVFDTFTGGVMTITTEVIPTAGSHLFAPYYQLTGGGGALFIGNTALSGPPVLIIKESTFASANNGTF